MPFVFRASTPDLRSLVIESTRVRLVTLSGAYAEEIYQNFTAEITRFMMPAPPSDISETHAFISSAQQGLDRGDDLHVVICRQGSGEFLGICGLHERRGPAELELGIWVKKAAHGNRYGLEAMRALRDWVEGHVDFERLIYPVDRRNIPSRKIAEALGGTIIEEKKVMSLSGTELDEVVYGIDRGRPW